MGPDPEVADLRDAFRSVFVAGRWLLAWAEGAESLRLLLGEELSQRALWALAVLSAYNLVSLILVHRLPPRRLPAGPLLALDLLLAGLAAFPTGGAFLNACTLILLAGALLYGVLGGVLVGAGAALLAGMLGQSDRSPYFLLIGTFTGYLMERLRSWFRSHQEDIARARERDIAAEATRREMALARAIQQAALPVTPPCAPGLQIAARCTWAHEVGGDFHLFLGEGERRGLVLGDVSGKGVAAALVATSVAHLLPWLDPLGDPGAALARLNRDLIERLPADAFVTLVFAEVDPGAGTLGLWSAGHPPALLWRAGERQVREAQAHNFFLAFREPWSAEPERLPFAPGDVLLLYSDGLIEARNDRGEIFGIERAAAVLAQNADKCVEEIAGALARAAGEWGPLTDDLTLLVCRRVAEGGT